VQHRVYIYIYSFILNNKGEEMVPWGIPARVAAKYEISEPIFVAKNLSSIYNLKISGKVEVELFLAYIGDQGANLCRSFG